MAYTLLDGTRIIIGPRDWSPKYFEYFLKTEYDINLQLPESSITEPFVINEQLRIVPTGFLESPTVDPLFEQLAGPRFSFDELGNHIAQFYTQEFDISTVKQNLKTEIAKVRWVSETTNITCNINGKVLTLYTDKESRAAYSQAYMMAQDDYLAVWKFPEGFISLNKLDLQQILNEINFYVQACFDWEAEKNNEIESKSTVAELRTIILTRI